MVGSIFFYILNYLPSQPQLPSLCRPVPQRGPLRVGLLYDVHRLAQIEGALAVAERIDGLAVRRLVPAKPLANARHSARQQTLDILDAMQRRRQRVVNTHTNKLPVQLAVVNQFIILPLSYLSGTFYHIDILPPLFYKISLWNPLFYLIDGFRYGFLGESDGNVMIGVVMAAVLNIILFILVLTAFKKGWKIKS